jgi:hypothetical protein
MTAKPMIPSMGGREMGPVYNRFIEAMPNGLDVVEIGAWLGAGTYELASALVEHGHTQSVLHVYDRFKARAQEVRKAAGLYKYRIEGVADGLGTPLKLIEGQDTLPIVRDFLKGIPADIRFYQGNIRNFQYTGKAIGILVIDAAKKGREFGKIMAKIEPHLAPGAVIFFMDYWFYKFKQGTGTECQHKYVKASGKYTHLESYINLCCEVMRYEVA